MKDKLVSIIFVLYIFFFSVLGIITKDEDISYTERRKLHTIPNFTLDSEYINKLDKYFLDHFPFRDEFRSVKANFNYKILSKLDNNNIYLKDNYIYKSEYPTNYKSIDKFSDYIYKTKSYFNNSNTYIMIIPDKNYYLEDDNFLHIDYDYIYKMVNKLDMKTIDIRSIMNIYDYYETDTHWKQEKLSKVVSEMGRVMDFNYHNHTYNQNIYNSFYGVYYGESAIDREAESLTYLTNSNMNHLSVKYLENPNLNTIYNLEKLDSIDAYEVYLDGASSFIEIYNENAYTNKELIIFRDSFASSIVPLITPYYKKITLVDNRYITSSIYLNLIDYNNQDILFMYSSLIVNNSLSLKE